MKSSEVEAFKLSTRTLTHGLQTIYFAHGDSEIAALLDIDVDKASAYLKEIKYPNSLDRSKAIAIVFNLLLMRTGLYSTVLTTYCLSEPVTQADPISKGFFDSIWFLYPDFQKIHATPLSGGEEFFIMTCSLSKAFTILDAQGKKFAVKRCLPPIESTNETE